MEALIGIASGFWHTLERVIPITIAIALTFSLLSWWSPCNEGKPWWKKSGLFTDVAYWIFIPIFTRYVRIGLTILFTIYLLGITTSEEMIKLYDHGHGPLATLPLWVQAAIFVIGSDFLLYWTHRTFHRGVLWKYHAVHHASKDLEWTSAWRFHPFNLMLGTVMVDVVFILAGISTDIFFFVGPFTTFTSAMVHANLDWTFGPLKRVIASPVFHRWHHTGPQEGGESNFAGTFSLWDAMFGTYYMPAGVKPQTYGIEDEKFPANFGLQFFYPILH